MRGLDTNVILRYVTADDPVQTPVVAALFDQAEEAREQLFVSVIAVCELVWSLRGKPYALPRAAIEEVLRRILETHLFEIQDRELVRLALEDYSSGRGDFSDYLLGHQGRRAGCDATLTFDRKLHGAPGFSPPASSASPTTRRDHRRYRAEDSLDAALRVLDKVQDGKVRALFGWSIAPRPGRQPTLEAGGAVRRIK